MKSTENSIQMVRPKLSLMASLKVFSRGASAAVVLIGFSVLVGWVFDIQLLKSILPNLISMKANTAVTFMLAGISLWLLQKEPVEGPQRSVARGLALIVGIVGLLTLAEYVFGWNLGIDQLLFPEEAGTVGTLHPGRPSPIAALNFLLMGGALILLSFEHAPGYLYAQYLTLVVAALSGMVLIGYAYGVVSFYKLGSQTASALHTGVGFAFLSAGVLFARPDRGLMGLITREGIGGRLLRRGLPVAVGAPLLLGWLRLEGQRAGLYGTEFGIVLLASATIVLFTGLLLSYARSLEASDSQQKKAEEEINRLFNLSLDLQGIAGFDGYFKRLNPAWEKALGFTTAELTARPYVEFIHPEDREATLAEADKLSAGQVTISFENRYRCKDGSYKWLFWNSYPIPEEQLIYCAARDITERKRAEEALRKSEAKFRGLLESATDGIVIVEHSGRIVLLNPQAERMFGYEPGELLGQHIEILVPERFRAEHGKQHAKYFSSPVHEMGSGADASALRKDGSEFPISLMLSSFESDEGPLAMSIVRDISERKQAEKALQASEAKFRGLLEGAATPIVGVNSHGLIVLVNAATERLFGYTREELLGQPLETLVPERFREVHGGHRMRYVTQPSTRPMGLCMDLFARRKDGSEVPVEISLSPAETPEGLLAMAIIIDISARKRAEERLKKHAAELQAVNAELDAFTYSVAHDLRSPLRRTDGFAQLLLDEYNAGLPDEARHYLHRVREGTHQMGQLVDDLLKLAQIGRKDVTLQVTGLSSLVEEVVAELKRETEGRAIEWKIGPLPFVECDPALLKVVFTNLLFNAVKFTRPREQAVIEVGAEKKDGEVIVFIRDNGVGFSMKYAHKLFGVFQRLHRAEDFEGTGVGLATVQRIVHKHGGQIWAEAELDKGASFYFKLGTQPQIEPETRSGSGKESDAAGRDRNSIS